MKLNDFLETIDEKALRELIEAEPCYESKMLKAAFRDITILGMPAVELYRMHFALFHKLYSMQNEYVNEGKYLHVHFMRTGVFRYPEKGLCAYFNEDTMSFCNMPASAGSEHCAVHSEQLGDSALESISLKYFYLDKANYDKLDSVSAESLLSGAWEILSSDNSINDAYLTLGLHGHENLATVKIRFRELCKQYHPDQSDGDKDKFMDVNRAYRFITKWMEQSDPLR
jgi:hypothetical protein